MKKITFSLFFISLLCLSANAQQFTIHLMGDSTCAQKDLSKGTPERGWGMLFRGFTDDSVKVINYAVNGRSTRSFRERGDWNKVKANLKPGDYVFIQFGHNDEKVSDPPAYAWSGFQDNLRAYIDTVRLFGAHPVLLTPCARRWFKDGVFDPTSHGVFPDAIKAVGKETGTPVIDITKATCEWIESIGDEASRPYYMHLAPGEFPSHPDGIEDDTHTVARGARKIAEIISDSLRVRIPEIGRHLDIPDIIVDKDGNGDYRTLGEAYDAISALPEEKNVYVRVNPAEFKEHITVKRTVK